MLAGFSQQNELIVFAVTADLVSWANMVDGKILCALLQLNAFSQGIAYQPRGHKGPVNVLLGRQRIGLLGVSRNVNPFTMPGHQV